MSFLTMFGRMYTKVSIRSSLTGIITYTTITLAIFWTFIINKFCCSRRIFAKWRRCYNRFIYWKFFIKCIKKRVTSTVILRSYASSLFAIKTSLTSIIIYTITFISKVYWSTSIRSTLMPIYTMFARIYTRWSKRSSITSFPFYKRPFFSWFISTYSTITVIITRAGFTYNCICFLWWRFYTRWTISTAYTTIIYYRCATTNIITIFFYCISCTITITTISTLTLTTSCRFIY